MHNRAHNHDQLLDAMSNQCSVLGIGLRRLNLAMLRRSMFRVSTVGICMHVRNGATDTTSKTRRDLPLRTNITANMPSSAHTAARGPASLCHLKKATAVPRSSAVMDISYHTSMRGQST